MSDAENKLVNLKGLLEFGSKCKEIFTPTCKTFDGVLPKAIKITSYKIGDNLRLAQFSCGLFILGLDDLNRAIDTKILLNWNNTGDGNIERIGTAVNEEESKIDAGTIVIDATGKLCVYLHNTFKVVQANLFIDGEGFPEYNIIETIEEYVLDEEGGYWDGVRNLAAIIILEAEGVEEDDNIPNKYVLIQDPPAPEIEQQNITLNTGSENVVIGVFPSPHIEAQIDTIQKSTLFSESKTIHLSGAVTGSVTTDFSGDTTIETSLNALDPGMSGLFDGLPKASESLLGAIKVGHNLLIEDDGTLNALNLTGLSKENLYEILPRTLVTQDLLEFPNLDNDIEYKYGAIYKPVFELSYSDNWVTQNPLFWAGDPMVSITENINTYIEPIFYMSSSNISNYSIENMLSKFISLDHCRGQLCVLEIKMNDPDKQLFVVSIYCDSNRIMHKSIYKDALLRCFPQIFSNTATTLNVKKTGFIYRIIFFPTVDVQVKYKESDARISEDYNHPITFINENVEKISKAIDTWDALNALDKEIAYYPERDEDTNNNIYNKNIYYGYRAQNATPKIGIKTTTTYKAEQYYNQDGFSFTILPISKATDTISKNDLLWSTHDNKLLSWTLELPLEMPKEAIYTNISSEPPFNVSLLLSEQQGSPSGNILAGIYKLCIYYTDKQTNLWVKLKEATTTIDTSLKNLLISTSLSDVKITAGMFPLLIIPATNKSTCTLLYRPWIEMYFKDFYPYDGLLGLSTLFIYKLPIMSLVYPKTIVSSEGFAVLGPNKKLYAYVDENGDILTNLTTQQ